MAFRQLTPRPDSLTKAHEPLFINMLPLIIDSFVVCKHKDVNRPRHKIQDGKLLITINSPQIGFGKGILRKLKDQWDLKGTIFTTAPQLKKTTSGTVSSSSMFLSCSEAWELLGFYSKGVDSEAKSEVKADSEAKTEISHGAALSVPSIGSMASGSPRLFFVKKPNPNPLTRAEYSSLLSCILTSLSENAKPKSLGGLSYDSIPKIDRDGKLWVNITSRQEGLAESVLSDFVTEHGLTGAIRTGNRTSYVCLSCSELIQLMSFFQPGWSQKSTAEIEVSDHTYQAHENMLSTASKLTEEHYNLQARMALTQVRVDRQSRFLAEIGMHRAEAAPGVTCDLAERKAAIEDAQQQLLSLRDAAQALRKSM